MMKVLFPIMIVAIIGGIVGIIFIIKLLKNNLDDEYKGANIMSFIFPAVGLIIYAVNVGKNDKLAKSCIKMALYGMGFGIILSIVIYCICMVFLYGIFSANVTHTKRKRINTAEKVENKDEEYDSIENLKNELLKDQYIINCELKTTGKIIYINIEYKNNEFYDKREVVNSIVKKFDLDRQYDYYININNEDQGIYSGLKNDYIVWSNQ